jgi:hypothetical protein
MATESPLLDWEKNQELSGHDEEHLRLLDKLQVDSGIVLDTTTRSQNSLIEPVKPGETYELLEETGGYRLISRASELYQSTRFISFPPVTPEYPQTHPDGIAYVMNVQHLLPDATEGARKLCKDMQYGTASRENDSKKWSATLVSPLLGGARCKVTKSVCSGVLHCQQLSDALKNYRHTMVTEETINAMAGLRDVLTSAHENAESLDRCQARTFAFAQEQMNRWTRKCGAQCPGGRPRAFQFSRQVSCRCQFLPVTLIDF